MATTDINKDFDLLEVGSNSQVEVIPPYKPVNGSLQLPLTTLPVGLPPILPDLKEELSERFLCCPEKLPQHGLERVQRYWPRESDSSTLYHTELTPLQTTLVVDRNPTTGQLLGYKEAFIDNAGVTAKNSTSLKRIPGPMSDGIRGSTTNFPFWPGGLNEPDLQGLTQSESAQINLETDLLETPPGFSKGMSFTKKSVTRLTTPKSEGGVINLRDILAEDQIIFEQDRALEMEQEAGQESRKDQEESHIQAADEDEETKAKLNDVIQLDEREEDPMTSRPVTLTSSGAPQDEWAIKVDIKTPVDDFYKRIPDMAYKWPFELDVFQKQAILHLEKHDNVFVAAHTSAGKTVIAEYAIALSMKHMTRSIYTSPIKALSNQKFRDFKETFGDVGLVTGDVQIHQEASCLIMTTEILRSMLYNGSDVIRDLEWVIFDEVHYINDAERGVVWEEVLIMLPKHVNIILLSATVPNTLEFAEWVGRTKKRQVYVVSTTKRPVPLEHFLYTGNSNKTSSELFMIVDSNKTFLTQGYNKAFDAKKERASKSSQSYGAKGTRGGNPHQDKGVWLSVIEMLRKKDKLPIVAFTFSKKRIEDNAGNLGSVDLLAEKEKSEVHLFFQHCTSKLKGTDKNLPQVQSMQHLLKRGIGLHHSGILPILKEVVEMLFQRGLVKVLFATETFAMGVNMPARTVVFDTIRKHDGTGFRDLLPGEYIQMAGRAGRRGLDTTGTVIILCKGDVPEMADLHKMMLGRPSLLSSQFRLTYTMMLNLLRVEQIRVQDMMKRSFSEFHNQKDQSKYEDKIKSLSKQVKTLPQVTDYSGDLEQYYEACDEYWALKHELTKIVLSHPQAVKSLIPGRLIVLDNKQFKNTLAVVLKTTNSATKGRIFTVLVITEDKMDDSFSNNTQEKTENPNDNVGNSDWMMPRPVLANQGLYHPEGKCGQKVLDIITDDISTISNKTIKIAADKVMDDVKKRQLPRFRNDPPGQSTSSATQEMFRIIESNPDGLASLDPVNDLRIRDIDLVERFQRLQFLQQNFGSFNCVNDPCFMENFTQLRTNRQTEEEYRNLRFRLSDDSLELLPEYWQRIDVLKELKYIDDTHNVQLKGRVACEISSHELIITELVFENALTSLHPTEIASLLSCVVFQDKRCNEPKLNPDLVKAKETFLSIAQRIGETLLEPSRLPSILFGRSFDTSDRAKETFLGIARRIGETQKACGLLEPVEDYVEQFKFGLLEVVFEWARGMPFSEITELTNVQEGIIVRTIQRLDEVLRDIRNAARIIGDPVLYQKMEEASSMIKRDIVFAASLYTQ